MKQTPNPPSAVSSELPAPCYQPASFSAPHRGPRYGSPDTRSFDESSRILVAIRGGHFIGDCSPDDPASASLGANERIAVGCIGVRNQGSGNLKRFMDAGADVVAVCDVDSKVAGAAAETVTKAGKTCDIVSDYRKLLERSDLDAFVITTPDHWHALMTIHACEAGKDVYCEKPLSLTIAEGRRMVNAARRNSRIVQTGSQQRSSSDFWRACMLVRNGLLGDISEVLVESRTPTIPGRLDRRTCADRAELRSMAGTSTV